MSNFKAKACNLCITVSGQVSWETLKRHTCTARACGCSRDWSPYEFSAREPHTNQQTRNASPMDWFERPGDESAKLKGHPLKYLARTWCEHRTNDHSRHGQYVEKAIHSRRSLKYIGLIIGNKLRRKKLQMNRPTGRTASWNDHMADIKYDSKKFEPSLRTSDIEPGEDYDGQSARKNLAFSLSSIVLDKTWIKSNFYEKSC